MIGFCRSTTVDDRSGPLHGGSQQATFYTIGNARYFPGVAALLNSLRLTGHRGELVILDCGFTPRQWDLLRAHCTLVDRPPEHVSSLWMLKPYPHLLRPEGTIVIIDSDMIVTRPLDTLVALADQGRICAFPDPESERWFGEWQQLFGLQGPLRRQVYVNAGFVAFSTRHWPHLLERYWEACQRIKAHLTIGEGAADGPSSQGDQDALNAVLMSEVPEEALALQPREEEPYLPLTRVVDRRTLACTYRGYSSVLLHQSGSPKPWDRRAWQHVHHNAYVRLLRRLLLEPDVALRVDPAELPLWLRPGLRGQLAIRGLDAMNAPALRRGVKTILPQPLVLQVRRGLRTLQARA
jgi:hypothetical protein